jgi:hypothetical protein
MNFAASAAGSRGRLWQGMADAARYARRDYMCGDPCYDPCVPYPSYCDPCAPPQSYCDPCATPWSYCDPCAPPQPYCDPCATPWSYCDPCAPDSIDLKVLKDYLALAVELKLAQKGKEITELEAYIKTLEGKPESKKELEEAAKKLADLKRDLVTAKAKADAETDAVIHAVKLARVAEAMRKKQWSRGPGHQRRY